MNDLEIRDRFGNVLDVFMILLNHETCWEIKLTWHAALQLLLCYKYNQQFIPDPPFSVSAEEVKHHYASVYQLNSVKSKEVAVN